MLKLNTPIFLTGFMGSGKTTQGKKLAKALNAQFIDLDSYITEKTAKTISEIFETEGEPFFRNLELECIQELVKSKTEPCVISLGGGSLCFNNVISIVLSSGVLIYLEMSAGALSQRLLNAKDERPLLKGKSEMELKTYIIEKLAEREMFYTQAQIKINGINATTPDLVKALKNYFDSK